MRWRFIKLGLLYVLLAAALGLGFGYLVYWFITKMSGLR